MTETICAAYSYSSLSRTFSDEVTSLRRECTKLAQIMMYTALDDLIILMQKIGMGLSYYNGGWILEGMQCFSCISDP